MASQSYLPPDQGDIAAFTQPVKAGNIFIHFIDRLTNIFVESTRNLVIALLCYGALEIVVVLLLLLLLLLLLNLELSTLEECKTKLTWLAQLGWLHTEVVYRGTQCSVTHDILRYLYNIYINILTYLLTYPSEDGYPFRY